MSLVIPVALPGLVPAAPSLYGGRSRRRRARRAVAPSDRERFRGAMRGVRSYRPTSLTVQVASSNPAAPSAPQELEGLGRFGGFRRLTKSLPRPKSALMMAALGPAALLDKGTRRDLTGFAKSKTGMLALAAMAPIGAPALLMTKRGRGMVPGLSKFTNSKAGALALGFATPLGMPAMLLTKQGRRMVGLNRVGSMFGRGGGGGDDEAAQPADQAPVQDGAQFSPMEAGYRSSAALQYDSGTDQQSQMPPDQSWQGPPYVTAATPPPDESAVSYQTDVDPGMMPADQPVMPGDSGFDPTRGLLPADSGPMVYDSAQALYQGESADAGADESGQEGATDG
jgi:hypothetical protein